MPEVTTIIRIQEQPGPHSSDATRSNAALSFSHGVQYPIDVHDPFASTPAQEANLEWYFEGYLTFPFTQDVRARNAAESIRDYGISLFKQIFADAHALDAYRQAVRQGVHTLQFEIAGSAEFHRLHWEALYDPELKQHLTLYAPLIRQNIHRQIQPAQMRPSPTINVLVVVARPGGTRDVGYRTISRPLVEELQKSGQRVDVTLLRPGTYQELHEHLERITRERGVGYYHVIHFDVHGALLSYDAFKEEAHPNRIIYQGRFGRADIPAYQGQKAFLFLESEKHDDQADPVEASEVAALLQRHHIPIAILNACQSGKAVAVVSEIAETQESAQTQESGEASLGSHLIAAGVQTVLAMGYSVTVSAAEMLMPVLYRELFQDHPLSAALCPARQALYNQKQRRAFFNKYIDLEDWVLPVLYQNEKVNFQPQPFTPIEETAFYQKQANLYRPVQEPTYGFIGRDVDILHIEKHLLTRRNLLLLRGMGGAGKTTLLHHLASWWQRTGLVEQVFYFGYDERAWSRQQIMSAIARRLLGREDLALFQSRSHEVQQVQLTKLLNSTRHLLILDNLESITGEHLAIRHTLSKKEQTNLHDFLTALVGAQTLVLLGSRSVEAWLAPGTFADNLYALPGLDPEAASQLAEQVLKRHKVERYQQDKDLRDLIKLLDGFPLALEVVLANLTRQTPAQVLSALHEGDVDLKTGESEKRTENILRCIDYSHSNLSPEAQQLLLCLSPFTSVIYLNTLDDYAAQLKQQPTLAALPVERLPEVVNEAGNWGLLTPDPNVPQFLHMQPTLPYFLRRRLASEEQQRIAIETAFLQHYQSLSPSINSLIKSKQPEEQRIGLLLAQFEYENLVSALRLAQREKSSLIDIYFVLDGYLNRLQEHRRGQELDSLLLEAFDKLSQEELTSAAGEDWVRILGTTANRQLEIRQLDAARDTYLKLLQMTGILSIDEKERSILQAGAYHQLGRVVGEQRKWEQAGEYYKQALQIFQEHQDRYHQAGTYHQLGCVAEEQRQWEQAQGYYQQALQIYEEYQDRYSQGSTYHQLGRVAQEQREWEQAQGYYKQALQIYEEYQDRYNQGSTYHQLGRVAQEQREWEQAQGYYKQALQIYEEYQDRYSQGSTYHNLGAVAQEQREWEQAQGYYKQALQIKEEYQDRYEQASTYHQLGRVAEEQRQWEQAQGYYKQALQIYEEYQDRYSKASTYHQLSRVAEEQREWEQAGGLFLQALSIFAEYKDNYRASIVLGSLARLWRATNDEALPERVAAVLSVTREEGEKLLRTAMGEEEDDGEEGESAEGV